MLGTREIKSILKERNIRVNKRLGQNFLIDETAQKKMIDAMALERDDVVLEIGPGLGALTQPLCAGTKKVVAIEKDKGLYRFLLENLKFSNLELVHGDILDFSFPAGAKIKVVGNLPYYISSPILIKLLNNRDFIESIFITVQKEFAERLIAGPGTKAYGSISCFVQFYTEPLVLFTVKKTAFYPPPKVDSCFLRLDVHSRGLYLTDEQKLFKIIRTCFEKRRKMILNSLWSNGGFASKKEISEGLEKAGISPSRRPETLSLQEFVNLANSIGGSFQ